MGNFEKNQDQEWIERIKSEGAVPLLDPDNCPNGWASPPGDMFLVRGPEYLKTKAKIPGGDYLLKPIGFDWLKGTAKITDLLSNPRYRVRRILDEEFSKGNKPFVWAFNLQVPSKDNYSAVAFFVDSEPRQEDSLITRFLNGDDGFRNSRLKLIANIVQGPWIVRKAVGEQAICIIGRALTCKYSTGNNYVEVDIDIGSSMVANAIVHLAFGYLTTLTVDLAFVIEGQTETELPERILGAVRFSELNTASARSVELISGGSTGSLQSSLPTSFWKSVGQGFSQFLNPSGQGSDSNSRASCVDGVIDHDKNIEDIKNQ
ncbi:protein ENHANCED DISEASE RESISTANCE 2 [Dorcoceras hygrometricum]|nr:protein ENHANCED DISEASE RESISTANCE 2 [Dorcoceras hygrometricum]